ncbi:MAG: Holliday junction branch migration protein RuvA [Firmicutes bacterium]|nr:Holliday junction branch migration protein RuvA [Candidatus Fermentithermobacillaceae bacterium]
MISELRGTVLACRGSKIVLDVNGVGFEVNVGPDRASAYRPGQEARVFTRLIFREDGLYLYGFQAEEERAVFDLLLTVRGIGPKQALALAAFLEPSDFYRAVLSQDDATLAKCPGVGRKTASRILVELRDKIGLAAEERCGSRTSKPANVWEDALEGLVALGYTQEEVRPILDEVKREGVASDLETILREALKRIARRR